MYSFPWVSTGHLLNLASSHWFCLPTEKQLHFLSCWFVLIKLLSDIKHRIKEDEFCLFTLDVFWSSFDVCFPLSQAEPLCDTHCHWPFSVRPVHPAQGNGLVLLLGPCLLGHLMVFKAKWCRTRLFLLVKNKIHVLSLVLSYICNVFI